jgi:hypothetical protein
MRPTSKALLLFVGAAVLGCTGGSDDFVIRETGFRGDDTCADFDDRPDLPGTVYVAWWAEEGGDGTRALPLLSFDAALALEPRQIVVSPGTYSDDVTITTGHDVELLAACVDQETLITGVAVDDGVVLLGGVRVQELIVSGGAVHGADAVINGLTMTGGQVALDTTTFGAVQVDGGAFTSVAGTLQGLPAIEAGAGAVIQIQGGLVEGPLLLDQDGASVTVTDAELDVGSTAVAVVSGDSALALVDASVPQTAVALLKQSAGTVSISGMNAICRRADGPSIDVSGGSLEIESSTLELDQIAVSDGAATLSDVALTRSLRTEMPALLVSGGLVTVDGLVLLEGTSGRTWAAAAQVTGGELDAHDVHARTLDDGVALRVSGDGVLGCTGCSLQGAAAASGGTLSLTDTQMTHGIQGLTLDGGSTPVTATLSEVTLDNQGNVALYARGDVQLAVSDSVFETSPFGVVAAGLGDGAVSLTGSSLTGHQVVGVLLDDTGGALTELTLADNGIDVKQQACEDVTPVTVDGANEQICDGSPLGLPNWPE